MHKISLVRGNVSKSDVDLPTELENDGRGDFFASTLYEFAMPMRNDVVE